MDLALNKLQRLICHKTKQTKPNQFSVDQFSHPVVASLVTFLCQFSAFAYNEVYNLIFFNE